MSSATSTGHDDGANDLAERERQARELSDHGGAAQVAAPPGDSFGWAEQAWRWLSGAITSLGGLAVSLTAIVTLAVLLA
ncbi:hypothetical protein [Streptomyces sp. NPDC057696]|uniref:hypothetical protein n=1 Tax=Streptomyces sp. NPDC057696 TaxID=3346218 RepID=UPI0036982D41